MFPWSGVCIVHVIVVVCLFVLCFLIGSTCHFFYVTFLPAESSRMKGNFPSGIETIFVLNTGNSDYGRDLSRKQG